MLCIRTLYDIVEGTTTEIWRRVFCVEWNQAGVPAEPIYSEPQTTEGVVRLFSITQIKLY